MAGAVLVTGVGGFFGGHVAGGFLALGKEVRGIDNLSGGYKDNVPDEVDFRIADARHPNAYRELLDGVEIVYGRAAAHYEGLSVFFRRSTFTRTRAARRSR
jgi:UDP-glucose 4-epimerase